MDEGRERTEDAYRHSMGKSNFRVSRIIHTRENISVIEGVPE